MPYPLVTDGAIMQVNIRSTYAAQEMMTLLHYVVDLTGATADPAIDICYTRIFDGLNAAGGVLEKYCNAVVSTLTNIRVLVQNINPLRYAPIQFSPTSTIGALTPPGTPPCVAGTIVLKSLGASRHSRGVKHIPGTPSAAVTNGLLSGAQIVLLEELGLQMTDAFTGGDGEHYRPVIYNRAVPINSEVIEVRSVNPEARTMRRRVVGRGI